MKYITGLQLDWYGKLMLTGFTISFLMVIVCIAVYVTVQRDNEPIVWFYDESVISV